MTPISLDFSDEDVVVQKLLFVASKKLFVELEGTAPFTINGEVSHGFSGIVEFLRVLDLDNSRIEWSGEISSNLWLSVNKGDFGLLLKFLSNLGGSDVYLWKIVEVDKVLVSE